VKIKLLVTIGIIAVLASCAATPPVREVSLPSQSLNEPLKSGVIQLVIFNDSNILMYGIDNSGKINIHHNGKGVGQLNIGQYVILSVAEGYHTINLLHKDIANFGSTHQLKVSESPTYLKIYAKVTSNGAEIVPKPENFEEKFKPAY